MSNEDRRVTAPLTKGSKTLRPVWTLIAILVVGGLAFAAFAVRDDGKVVRDSGGEVVDSPLTSHATTSIDEQTEIVPRLKEILAERQRAYRIRDPKVLERIYTVDCPCLESDTNAIRELISADYIWVGGETSIQVRRTERVAARMWIVIADFSSESLRIETKSGQLVRKEPEDRSLFQFVLAKPRESNRWLLGRASSYEDG
jgi:hypothetical protein